MIQALIWIWKIQVDSTRLYTWISSILPYESRSILVARLKDVDTIRWIDRWFGLIDACMGWDGGVQAITNGMVKSAAHRAVVNAENDRYSTVYFYGIDNTITLTVPPELVTPERPLKYRPFTVTEHRKFIVDNEAPLFAVRHLLIDPASEGSWLPSCRSCLGRNV